MDAEITSLENKVDQLIDLYQQISAENIALRARVAALENENRDLSQRMETARERLEAILPTLPEL